jgi:hypothetical protein
VAFSLAMTEAGRKRCQGSVFFLLIAHSLVIIAPVPFVGGVERMKSGFIGAIICIAVFSCVGVSVAPANDGSAGITFLHLRATADGFELIDAKTVNGSLRSGRYDSARPGLHVEVRSADDHLLFRDVYPDPTINRLEYEDPEHPGKILAKEITKQEFTIRVPYFAEGRTVHFYRRLGGAVTKSNQPLLIHQGQVSLPPK